MYRHDLESFLYVFLWIVISNGAENPPVGSKLRVWNRGAWYELAMQKSHDMHKENFRETLAEFPTHNSLKPFAEALRQILFPIDGACGRGLIVRPNSCMRFMRESLGRLRGHREREKELII